MYICMFVLMLFFCCCFLDSGDKSWAKSALKLEFYTMYYAFEKSRKESARGKEARTLNISVSLRKYKCVNVRFESSPWIFRTFQDLKASPQMNFFRCFFCGKWLAKVFIRQKISTALATQKNIYVQRNVPLRVSSHAETIFSTFILKHSVTRSENFATNVHTIQTR